MGPPVKTIAFYRVGGHRTLITMVYDTQIRIVFMGLINQLITGGGHIVVVT